LDRRRRFSLIDLVLVLGLVGTLYGVIDLVGQWRAPQLAEEQIDLSPWALPRYTFFSLSRGLLAYLLSLGFTLVYGYWAARDRLAERVLIPLLDILQSIPVLGFLPGLVIACVALFPSSHVGLELAAIIMIFTGQAWNMTFSYYHSLKSLPETFGEAATVYRFSAWQRWKWVEMPYATIGLVWNSMMSMAGGWFFLMINEAFKLGDRDYRLPGIGSYMSEAVKQGRVDCMLWAIAAMVGMIVALDQLLWRPVVAWSQKYRIEEGGYQEATTSWFLDWLRRSRLVHWLRDTLAGALARWRARAAAPATIPAKRAVEPANIRLAVGMVLSRLIFLLLLLGMGYGLWKLAGLLIEVPGHKWADLGLVAMLTLGRVLVATGLGTLWALPAGLAIGLSPRLSRLLQPVVQVLASFPAPMLFPLVVAGLARMGVGLNAGSIVLMLLGTQWYILFNVIAGAMAIPADLKEASRSYRFGLWQRFRVLYFPAVFPYLVTGWVTAAGGAWNASIVSEYPTFDYPALRGAVEPARGLGATISESFDNNDFALLAASVVVMSTLVVLFNRTVWRRLYRLAEQRYALNK
jgi:NitT/TauT family transport system permease protein